MLKKRNVFCLILTELFLLKYIHKHMIGVPFLFGVISFFLRIWVRLWVRGNDSCKHLYKTLMLVEYNLKI